MFDISHVFADTSPESAFCLSHVLLFALCATYTVDEVGALTAYVVFALVGLCFVYGLHFVPFYEGADFAVSVFTDILAFVSRC